ncbi:hypothetical protein [Microbispora catharanthi]|uniref:hypothetical protein n=1 Tax=Microbispora catharanthi TaxID=1712871 RepID=UPI00142EDF79|nr:hypothetical protein [Microbispora catharanthi]
MAVQACSEVLAELGGHLADGHAGDAEVVEEEKGLHQRATQVATTEADLMKTGTGLKPYADVCGCGVVHG